MLKIPPTKKKFVENARNGGVSPVYTVLPFIPPQDMYERLDAPNSFLLESIKGPDRISRYSFVMTLTSQTCRRLTRKMFFITS